MHKEIILNRIKCLLLSNQEAILLTSKENQLYFTGFGTSDCFVLLTQSVNYFFADSRYDELARKACGNKIEVISVKKYSEQLLEVIKKHSIKNIYLETQNVTLGRYNNLVTIFKNQGVSFDTTGTLDISINNLRLVKTPQEVENIIKAQKIAEKSYTEILNYVKVGESERKIAARLEYLMKKNGAEDIAFDLITLTGKNTSMPHGVPMSTKIKNGDVFQFDIGAKYNGYHSDMSRVVFIGNTTEEQQKIYNIVLSAQEKAILNTKAGVYAHDVDNAARKVIEQAGYGSNFGHSTGHGVGLNIHEAPSVAPGLKTFLSEGMVITVEPGIYLKEKFGIRIEDMLLVTKDGFKNLTNISKEITIL